MFIKMRESKGFTLVELMIVVAIIGILAAVAVPYYQKYIQKSRLTSLVWPGVHMLETDMASYYSLNNTFLAATSATFTTFEGDANTHYFSATNADDGSFTITITASGATSPLLALNNQTLMAKPNTSNGMIRSWSYSGDIATVLGLGTGEQ
jgi:type IV pilus assembly protein PilA